MLPKLPRLTISRLDHLLTYQTITVYPSKEQGEQFNRLRVFTVNGYTYTIEWWINLCYLTSHGMTVIFDQIEITNTWPNHFEMDMQLLRKDRVIGLIKLK